MMRRRYILKATGALTPLMLAGCGMFGGDEPPPPPPPPPDPTIASVTIRAGLDVNPDPGGIAKPVAVRVFRLKGVQAFATTDFFTLDGDPAAALGDEMVAMDNLVLAPGGVQVYQHEMEPEARFIGIAVAFRDIDRASWRAWYEVPPNRTTLLTAAIGPAAVTLREGI